MARPEAVVSVQAVWAGMGKRAASQRRQCEHIQIIFSQMPWVSPLTLPGYQVLVDTLELMNLIKGQAVPMSASQYRCASVGAC